MVAGTGNLAQLDRREFLGAAGAVAVLPYASLIPVAPVAAAVTGPELAGDWSVDDQWQGVPRYSESIGLPRPRPFVPPAVDPADAIFVDL